MCGNCRVLWQIEYYVQIINICASLNSLLEALWLHNGKEAVETVENNINKFNGYKMSIMNGYDACFLIKQISDVLVVACTLWCILVILKNRNIIVLLKNF